MDYKKKYNEIIVKLQDLLNNAKKRGHIVVRTEDIENIFPELNESEDERIKREIIAYINELADLKNEKIPTKWLAWLEEQGKKDKLIRRLGEYKVKYTQKVLQEDLNKNTKSQSQPKFKVGDKVTIEGDDTIYTIYSIDLEEYCWLTYEGRECGWAKLDSLKHYVE